MSDPVYRPILLTKRGERSGLADIDDSAVKDRMNPLFVVEPIPWNYDDGAPAKTADEHLANKALDLAQTWGQRPAAVDLMFLDDTPMHGGRHPLEWLTERANSLGFALSPAVGPERTDAYISAAAAAMERDGNGATVRLSTDHWPMTAGVGELDQLLTDLGVGPGEVDLVLDLGSEVAEAPNLARTITFAQVANLPYEHEWRSVTLAGAGFPKALTDVPRGLTVIDRAEWTLFGSLVGRHGGRLPLFGDYAVAHPDPTVDVNPAFMSVSASFRYTVGDAWLVAKGELFKGQGGSGLGAAAVPPIAGLLCSHGDFLDGHCTTETWLRQVASDGGGGNPEQWRRRATTHHLRVVVGQVSSLLDT